jgi:hypothetical protein
LGINGITDAVQRQNMHLLNPGGTFTGNANMNIGIAQGVRHFSATPARQTNDHHFALMGGLNGGQYIA